MRRFRHAPTELRLIVRNTAAVSGLSMETVRNANSRAHVDSYGRRRQQALIHALTHPSGSRHVLPYPCRLSINAEMPTVAKVEDVSDTA